MPGVWHCWRDNGHNAHRPILLRTFPVTSPWKIKAKAKTQREEKLQTSIIWVQPTVSSRRKRILTGHFYFCGPISLSLLHHEKNKNREYVKYIPHWWMNRNKRLHKRAQINIYFEPQMTLSSCIHIIPAFSSIWKKQVRKRTVLSPTQTDILSFSKCVQQQYSPEIISR